MDWFSAINEALLCSDPILKTEKTTALFEGWCKTPILPVKYPAITAQPGRPAHPELVPPANVPKRGIGTIRGRAVLMHAVAHIEFNAINLALDMALRFAKDDVFENSSDRLEFITDWLSVAADEARHFNLIEGYLASKGFRYGTFPAHSGLWDAAEDTSGDIAARLAVAPMVLEARGLDVTPQIIEKLRKNNDPEAISILEVILEEEVQHVFFGTKWFNYVARRRQKEPTEYFHELVRAHFRGILKKPFNNEARFEAQLYEEYYLPLS